MTTSILALTESLLRRPTMYTPKGSFAETVAFIRGYISGVARVSYSEPLILEWEIFETWLAGKIHAPPTRALEALLDSQDASELLLAMLKEYRSDRF